MGFFKVPVTRVDPQHGEVWRSPYLPAGEQPLVPPCFLYDYDRAMQRSAPAVLGQAWSFGPPWRNPHIAAPRRLIELAPTGGNSFCGKNFLSYEYYQN